MDAAYIEARILDVLADEEFRGIVSVYLFGSVAAGRQHLDSDIDVGVILDRSKYPTEDQRFEQRVALSAALSGIDERPADVVVLNDTPPTFRRAVVTKGRRIACSDPEDDHAFVRDALLQAPDLEMWLRRMRAIKLDAIAPP